MLQLDLTQRRCECDGHIYCWSEPRLDLRKKRYRFILHEAIKPCKGRPEAELSIDMDSYNDDAVRVKITTKVLSFESHRAAKAEQILSDYVLTDKKWEEIRIFFCWSTDTAREYRGILKNHFDSILSLPITEITTADIEHCIDESVRSSATNYKDSTLQTWLKVINRIFVYLCAVYPDRIRNPVRFNGRNIRESRVNEKQRIRSARISQRTLYDAQERRLLFSFLEDLKAGDYRSVAGITMMESGRRPIEAGAVSPELCSRPDGEDFLSCSVLETDNRGAIIGKHKNERAKRLIPVSPVLGAIIDYAAKNHLRSDKFFCSAQISKYVHDKLRSSDIDITVPVEDAGEDSNDNRRAYILRYTFETNMVSFLRLDRVQYIMGHKRVTSSHDKERKPAEFYMAPQVQREIYQALSARDFAVYGDTIVDDVNRFLNSP